MSTTNPETTDFFTIFILGLCPDSWYYYDQNCWYFADAEVESVPWKAAQDICHSGSEFAHIISIHNDKVQYIQYTVRPWLLFEALCL